MAGFRCSASSSWGGRRVRRGLGVGELFPYALQASQARVIFLRFSGCCWGAGVDEAWDSGDTAAIACGKDCEQAETLGGVCFSSSDRRLRAGPPDFRARILAPPALIPRLTAPRLPCSTHHQTDSSAAPRRPPPRRRSPRALGARRAGGRATLNGRSWAACAPPVFRRASAAPPTSWRSYPLVLPTCAPPSSTRSRH